MICHGTEQGALLLWLGHWSMANARLDKWADGWPSTSANMLLAEKVKTKSPAAGVSLDLGCAHSKNKALVDQQKRWMEWWCRVGGSLWNFQTFGPHKLSQHFSKMPAWICFAVIAHGHFQSSWRQMNWLGPGLCLFKESAAQHDAPSFLGSFSRFSFCHSPEQPSNKGAFSCRR